MKQKLRMQVISLPSPDILHDQRRLVEEDQLSFCLPHVMLFSTVIDAQNLNDISLQSIGDDKGRLGDDQLTRRAVCWYGDRAVCASRVCR